LNEGRDFSQRYSYRIFRDRARGSKCELTLHIRWTIRCMRIIAATLCRRATTATCT
jgi:hypothetical protein